MPNIYNAAKIEFLIYKRGREREMKTEMGSHKSISFSSQPKI